MRVVLVLLGEREIGDATVDNFADMYVAIPSKKLQTLHHQHASCVRTPPLLRLSGSDEGCLIVQLAEQITLFLHRADRQRSRGRKYQSNSACGMQKDTTRFTGDNCFQLIIGKKTLLCNAAYPHKTQSYQTLGIIS